MLKKKLMFAANIDPTRRHLLLQIVGGRAFLEHLNDNDVDSSFTIHVHFRGQRFRSQPTPCACEPNFNEAFVLEVHKETSGISCYMHSLWTRQSSNTLFRITLKLCQYFHVNGRLCVTYLFLQCYGCGSEIDLPMEKYVLYWNHFSHFETSL